MYKPKRNKPDYQSHDNGYSWRIIGNWDFKRIGSEVQFAGMYGGQKNYWVSAKIDNGELTIANPKNVTIPQYAMGIVVSMLNQSQPTI